MAGPRHRLAHLLRHPSRWERWSEQRQAPGNTSHGPTVADFGGNLFIAWKGLDTDPRLFDAVSRDAGHTWSDQTQVGGSTSHSPALAVFNGRLYLAWKGGGDDQRLFYTSTPDGLVACHEIPSNFKSFRTPGKYT